MTSPSGASPAASINRQYITEKDTYFTDLTLWPVHPSLDVEAWLGNFVEPEAEHALHLLNAFLYFSDTLVNEIFAAAFIGLSRLVVKSGETWALNIQYWQAFLDNAIITNVMGESPNPSDSGYIFTRKARQVLGLREEQILDPPETLSTLINRGPRPVIFVDDFAGSGNQFLTTWHRDDLLPTRVATSFHKIAGIIGSSNFYYCPAFATEFSIRRLQVSCPNVIISPGHVISSRYGALAPDSVIWPAHLRPTAEQFLRAASARAGIPDTNGTLPGDWRGFAGLGLALAFHHSVPDATLPIFYWEQNGWHPLLRRS